MPSLQGNWIDLIILALLAFYVLDGWDRGFLPLIAHLVSFLGSLVVALRFYPLAAKLLVANFTLPHAIANALGFLSIAIFTEMLLSHVFTQLLLPRIPQKVWHARWHKFLGIFPSLLNGLILIAFLLTLAIALPIRPHIKTAIQESKIGGPLVNQTVDLEHRLADIFGEALQDTLTYLTVEPQSRERIELPVAPQELFVDTTSEQQMLGRVNQERKSRGLEALVWDEKIADVARNHSLDMWERKYFSHINPDGQDPSGRLLEGGISFHVAGENLALAPTVALAHQGLMNSEGHRKNILGPRFAKIGIGVIDGGIYGKMFTQNFTD